MFKPMLASDADLSTLRFPVVASPKLDGIRAIVIDGVVMSRSLKPIPNKYVQSLFANCEYFDGELIVGDPTSQTVYRDTVSHVMAHDKKDFDVRFYVFDHIADLDATYSVRSKQLKSGVKEVKNKRVLLHDSQVINGGSHLVDYETRCLVLGYEGLILRDPYSKYKCGRGTAKEQIILKLKRFVDDEAVITGFDERMENTNEKTTNELGRSKRSSHQAGKVGRGDLGALQCDFNGIKFNIGTGFDDALRAEIWANKPKYLGQLAKFKHFPIGTKDAPRHPVFLGFRDRSDT
ncbi:MAG: ATP-dependent DNA ligase [Patescibacteria group bacterium]|nr:ATP-dependent DNA ligase [Patescibacteria group bacterium]